MRRKVAEFPNTYGKDFTIADCHLPGLFQRGMATFEKNPDLFADESFLTDYYWGDERRHMLPWSKVNNVYVPFNLANKHWVLSVVRLQEWRIDVYDCDQTLYKDQMFLDFFKPISVMLPYLLDKAMSEQEKRLYPQMTLSELPINRIPHPTVPKAKGSGDCGVFLLAHMEYLTANRDISEVVSDHMLFWRKKWAVRLFHQLTTV